ncbi:MAG: RdgB/HAM1 family non-canonical purine NTP pyrophosphatase [Alphaproteobacteria bacterium]
MRTLAPGHRLVVATHNTGKLAEFAGLFAPYGLHTVSAADMGLAEPEETGATFTDNAALKALAAARGSALVALADDSGLAVDALDGAPGIHSARWAGAPRDFTAAMGKVHARLQAAGASAPDARGAAFVAVICLAQPDGVHRFYRGEVRGTIVWPPRGAGGFGYDPIFVPQGHKATFAEMSAAEKQALSHRARAFAALAAAEFAT